MARFELLGRSAESEILDDPLVSQAVRATAYAQLQNTHKWLGNTRTILRLLRQDPMPIRRVLDIGCAHGALLQLIHRELGAEVVGFDMSPAPADSSVPILIGNAITDPLPPSDVTLAVCMAHHLSDSDLIRLIQNVSKSSRRFILLDLVRHRLPLSLFRAFVCPFLGTLNALDGITSLRRSYTPTELRSVVAKALKESGAKVKHTVSPLYIRQVIDISW